MTYAEKLKHPKWQRKRLEILSRDNFKCRLCGDEETELHVHHKEYHNGCEPWEYENSLLVTLCKHCHFITEDAVVENKIEVLQVMRTFVDKEFNRRKLFFYVVVRDLEIDRFFIYIYHKDEEDKNIRFIDVLPHTFIQSFDKVIKKHGKNKNNKASVLDK